MSSSWAAGFSWMLPRPGESQSPPEGETRWESGSCVLVLGAGAVQVTCSEWDRDYCSNDSMRVRTKPSLPLIRVPVPGITPRCHLQWGPRSTGWFVGAVVCLLLPVRSVAGLLVGM